MVLQLNEDALCILQSRYLKKDHQGAIIESPEEMFQGVPDHIAWTGRRFGHKTKADGADPHLWIESALLVLIRKIQKSFLKKKDTCYNRRTWR
jgi:ribonucleotide reductase alpha subunit